MRIFKDIRQELAVQALECRVRYEEAKEKEVRIPEDFREPLEHKKYDF